MERYDLRLVLSTKDLLRASTKHPSRTALLIGSPDFTLNVKQEQAALRTLGFPSAGADVDPRLPATYSVAHAGTALSRLPRHRRRGRCHSRTDERPWMEGTVYTREFALKSTVETTRSPLVLHLATHGFFKPTQRRSDAGNPSQSEDPMLRSGLYFAGANRTLGGESGHNPDNWGSAYCHGSRQPEPRAVPQLVVLQCLRYGSWRNRRWRRSVRPASSVSGSGCAGDPDVAIVQSQTVKDTGINASVLLSVASRSGNT